MKIHFDTDYDSGVLTPALVLRNLKCDHCEDSHGFAIELSLFCWSIALVVEGS